MAGAKFDASWWDVWEMRKQAREVAKEQGMKRGADVDSFRHAYVSAKIADRYNINDPNIVTMGLPTREGDKFARLLGIGNEIAGVNNTSEEHYADLRNNEVGLKILSDVDEEIKSKRATNEWSPEEAEKVKEDLLRQRVAEAVQAGQLNKNPYDEKAPSFWDIFRGK